jgi:hypothetical protein
MTISKFWFGFLLGLCPFIITESFRYAFISRGCCVLGGELFTLILPILIIQWRIWSVNHIREERRKQKERMR